MFHFIVPKPRSKQRTDVQILVALSNSHGIESVCIVFVQQHLVEPIILSHNPHQKVKKKIIDSLSSHTFDNPFHKIQVLAATICTHLGLWVASNSISFWAVEAAP